LISLSKSTIRRLHEYNLAKKAKEEAIPPNGKIEKEDWQTLRELLQKAAAKQGGQRPLARQLGISESVIRRFIKGECKTISAENVAKIKQVVKPE
jgi:DNA-binding Xre family transcriptional regulator